jgi:hypothetical protein
VCGVFLIRHLPTNEHEIVRAAKEVIAEHGDAAIIQADLHHQTWEVIREVIRDLLESDAKKGHA